MDNNQGRQELQKSLNMKDILALAFGTMIGWGWIMLAGSWVGNGGSIGAMIAFAFGGVMAIFVGLTYAELTPMLPLSGGELVFSYRAMGYNASWFTGWMITLAYLGVAAWEGPALSNALNFLFSGLLPQDPAVSIKTRIGFENASEGVRLMTVFNRYPVTQLTIHARRQIDYYKGTPDLDAFGSMLSASRHPICYNGDLFTIEDVKAFTVRFPQVDTLMIGRGLLRDPALVRALQGGAPASKEELHAYVRALFAAYSESSYGPANAVHRMKELWLYLITQFPETGRAKKKLLRAASPQAYEKAVEELFAE